ncbi:MAG: hypothetical protein CM15mP120_26910 [Pseudomonadota bacterium]|nr:MAG: hypothetical protein CM15mP120_26910 [Pseudomonadota bacterium]
MAFNMRCLASFDVGLRLEYELDLHQKTVKEAQQEVFTLLQRVRPQQWRCVLISHGKGERSATPGRLKSYVAQWLIDHPDVIAYCSAQRMHGSRLGLCAGQKVCGG